MITISGKPGSGKSTIARALAAKLGYAHHSAGDLFREIARRRGLTPLELNERIHSDPSIDREIDAATRKLGRTKKNFVLDARLGFLFLPHSFKVFLDVSPAVAGKRVFSQMRESEQENTSIRRTIQNLATRLQNETRDYEKRYHVTYTDPRHFDLVIDSSRRRPEAIVEYIERALARQTARQTHIKEKTPVQLSSTKKVWSNGRSHSKRNSRSRRND